MRYLGSKTLLLEQLFSLVDGYQGGVFCDPFGGIGTVGAHMKKNGFHVVTGDILNFAYCFQYSLIELDHELDFKRLKQHLNVQNNIEIEEHLTSTVCNRGWLIDEYALKRKFFTLENAKHIQGCVDDINNWAENGIINLSEKKVLLASLINSFDKVANTAGTYYAYLKSFNRKSEKKFRFTFLQPIQGKKSHAFQMNANSLVRGIDCDVLYLDPPYNSRDYGKYYHLPETVSYGIVPTPVGKSGMFQYRALKSQYNSKQAGKALEELICNSNAKCIIFHYTDNGLINMNEIREVMKSRGTRVSEYYFSVKGYITTNNSSKSQHHIIKVST